MTGKKNYRFSILIGSFCLFFLSLFVFLRQFSISLESIEVTRLTEELVEVSKSGTSLMRSQIHLSIQQLRTASRLLVSIDDSITFDEIFDSLCYISDHSDFVRIGLSDKEGNVIVTSGEQTNIADRDYFQHGMQGEVFVTDIMDSVFDDDLKIVIVSVPIFENETPVGVLYGVFEAAQFSEYYNQGESTNGRYFHIIDADGNFILKAEEDKDLFLDDNLWVSLKDFSFEGSVDLNTMKTSMDADASGLVRYGNEDENYLMYYAPLGINDWYVLSCTSYSYVYDHADYVQDDVVYFGIKLFGLFCILSIAMFAYEHSQNKKIMMNNERLMVTSEVLRIASNQTNNCIFEYDIHTKTMTFRNKNYLLDLYGDSIGNVPQVMIDNGRVRPDSVEPLRDLFAKIINGEKQGSVEVHVNGQAIEWEKITLINVFNGHHVVRTVGLVEDITEDKQRELRVLQDDEYRHAMMLDTIDSFEINVSEDRILNSKNTQRSYSDELLDYIKENIHPEDQKKVMLCCSIAQLNKMAEDGKNDVKVEYRIKKADNEYYWLESKIHLVQSVNGGALIAYIFIHDIHEKKVRELQLQYAAEHDLLTKLYNRTACMHYIDAFMNIDENMLDVHAFMVLDLDNFKEINDCFGHNMGDRVLQEVADKLTHQFRKDDIIGRLGGDEFIVFLKNIRSVENIEHQAEKLIHSIEKTYEQNGEAVTITASIGIAVAPKEGKNFAKLYELADIALYEVKEENKNGFRIYEEKSGK